MASTKGRNRRYLGNASALAFFAVGACKCSGCPSVSFGAVGDFPWPLASDLDENDEC